MSNISVTTNQSVIDVTNVNGVTVTTPEGQTIEVTVPNSSVNVTNTTDNITVSTGGTVILESGITSVNGNTGPIVVLDTDDISEGTTNKYFSQALARQSLSAGTGISYDSGTGVITNTSINTDTTYTQNASATTGGANLNLVGSDSTTDTVKFASGTNITVSRTDANTITIDGTDTNTTYTQNISSTTGGANLNLVGSDSSTDTVKFANGTGVTVAYTDANTATVSIGQPVATTDDVTFDDITANGKFIGEALRLTTDGTRAFPASVPLIIKEDGSVAVNDIQSWKSNGTYASPTTITPGDAVLGLTNIVYTGTWDGVTPQVGTEVGWSFGGDLYWLNDTNTATDTISPIAQYGYSTTRGSWNLSTFQTPDSDSTGTIQDNTTWKFDGQRLKAVTSDIGSFYTQIDSTPKITAVKANGDLVDFKFKTNGNFELPGDIKVGGNDIQASDGNVAETFSVISGQSPNTKFAGNVVKGIIRQTAAETNGDIWGFGTGTTSPVRGIYLDNSATSTTTTGKRNGIVMRNTANAPRNSIIGEVGRGTNPSSPTVVTGGTNLVEMAGGGYYGGGSDSGWTTGNGFGNTGSIRLNAGETWSSTNTGTNFTVLGSGIGPYAAVAPQILIQLSSNGGAIACDNPTFLTKAAAIGGTGKYMLDLFESRVDVGGQTLKINSRQEAGNSVIQAYAGSTDGTLTWDSSSWTNSGNLNVNGQNLHINESQSAGDSIITAYAGSTAGTLTWTGNEWQIQNGSSVGNRFIVEASDTNAVTSLYSITTDGSKYASTNWNSYRRVSGNNVATQVNDVLGEFKFNGNTNTGTGGPSVPGAPGGNVVVQATENWSGSANGTQMLFFAIKSGTLDSYAVLKANPASAELQSDTFTFKTAAASPKTLATLDTANTAINTDRLDVRGSTVDSPYMVLFKDGGNDVVLGLSQTRATQGYENAVFNFTTQRSADGINYTPTQNGDILGEYKFNGNAYTSTTPGTSGPTAFINVSATENWTNTAQGSRFNFSANRTGGTTAYTVIQGTPDQLDLQAATINLNSYTGTALTSAAINYTRTYGEFAYVNAAGFDIPAQNTIYTMPLDTTLNAQGTSISGTGSININVSGWYKIIMSLQATSSHNGVASFVFWLRKNGSDVANSKTEVDFLKDQKSVIAMDWLVNSDGNDYWEIVYATANAAYADIAFPTIAATSTPFVSPVAPAVIFNVIPIGA